MLSYPSTGAAEKTIVGGNQPKRRKFSQRSGLVLSLSPLPEVEGLLL